MPLERRDVLRAMSGKGFRELDGSHHFLWLYINGVKQSVHTMVSRGSEHRTISDKNVGKMARQVKLSGSQFRQFVECTLDEEGYLAVLRRNSDVRLSDTASG